MNSEPHWLTELRCQSVAGIAWLPREKAASREAVIRKGRVGLLGAARLFAGELHAAPDTYRIVGCGPTSLDRHGKRHEGLVWVARENPETLLYAISASCPPRLWIAAGRDAATLDALLDTYSGSVSQRPAPTHPSAAELRSVFEAGGLEAPQEPGTRQWNAFLGLAPDLAEVEKALLLGDFTDSFPTRLGSAATEDVTGTGIRVSMFDTLHSLSRIVLFADPRPLADHGLELITLRVVYGAHAEHDIVAALNGHFGVDFPTDLPLDVIGALCLDRPPMGAAALRQRLEAAAPDSEPGLELMALLGITGAPAEEVLAPYVDHADHFTRQVVVQVALATGARGILERAAQDADAEVSQAATTALSELGPAAPNPPDA